MRRLPVVLLVGTMLFAGCGDDDEDGESAGGNEDIVVLSVELTGEEEAPGPGDADGSGTAEVRVDQDGREVCVTLEVEGVDGVTAAHIHEGRPGVAGPVAVTLEAPTRGSSEGCVSTSSSIAEGLATSSRAFYVNVHNQEFPDGAVRGQLTE